MRRLHSICAVLAVTLAVSAPRVGRANPVKVSEIGVLADAPFYIGMAKGYFAAEKLEISLVHFNSAQQAVAPLSVDQLQVVGGGVSAALFNAFGRNWPVRIAMGRARDIADYSPNALIVRKDLQAKVSTLAGLKGLKVAINAPAATLQYMLGSMLATAGLKLTDVQTVYMPFPDMGPALGTKAVDAATTTEPFTSEYAHRGYSYTMTRASDVLRKPAMEVAVLLYNKEWADTHTDEANRFSVAYLRGARDYMDALLGGPKRGEVVSILTKYTRVKDPAAYDRMTWSWIDPNGDVSIDGLKAQQDWYAAHGTVPTKVSVEGMIDRRFVDYALKRLGRVKSKE
jgi:NitT/TauT family transport system substrate-binding protein